MARVEQRVVLTNRMGLHARPSSQISQLASDKKYEETAVYVIKDGLEVDAKSVLDLLMLAADCSTELVIAAEGPLASEVVEKLVKLIEDGFGELEVDA